MPNPTALVLAGYGLNCEEETAFAFRLAGGKADIRHVNDLAAAPETLDNYQILAVPGGFSYGDDTGSGNAFAHRLRHGLAEALTRFLARDTLAIGICNGCQILANLGVVPDEGERSVALVYNASNRYQCRWVDVAVSSQRSPWFKGLSHLHIPVAHGEGQFVMAEDTLARLKAEDKIAARYATPEGAPANGAFPANPNGAMDDIAAVTDASGRVLAMMPHPERAIFFHQREDWPLLQQQYTRTSKQPPEHGDGLALFRNAVGYFS